MQRLAPLAVDAKLAGGVLKAGTANLGAYGGQLTADRLRLAGAELSMIPISPACRAAAAAGPRRIRPSTASCRPGSHCAARHQPARADGEHAGHGLRQFPGMCHSRHQRRTDDPLADIGHAVRLAGKPGQQSGADTDLSQLLGVVSDRQATLTPIELDRTAGGVTGAGTIALDTQTMGFRVEPKLVMTTEGQRRAAERSASASP